MNRPQMSKSASALLRALLARAPGDQYRIFLTDWTSTDWHSLTFAGERHVAGFAIRGMDARMLAKRWIAGLGEADLPIGSSAFVGDIAARCEPHPLADGAVLVTMEALTLAA